MSKALKWVGISIGGLVVLIILILLVAPMFYDIQTYKPRIEEAVAKATGRPFAIGGELELTLFPWAAITLSDLHLGNPQGFAEEDFVEVESFDLQVKLLPLLSKNIQVKRFVILGPKLVLVRTKEGRANWDGMGGGKEAPRPEEKEAPGETPRDRTAGGLPIKDLAVGECAVRGGEILFIDHAAGTRREVKDLALELKEVSLDRPIALSLSARVDGKPVTLSGKLGPLGTDPGKGAMPLDLTLDALDALTLSMKGTLTDAALQPAFDLGIQVDPFSPRKLMEALGGKGAIQTRDPEALSSVALRMRVKGGPEAVSVSEGSLDLDQSRLAFSAEATAFEKPDLSFALDLDRIDLDRYLPARDEAGPQAGEGTPGGKKKTSRKDYAPLRKPVLDGEIRIGELLVKGALLRDVQMKIRGEKGVYRLDPIACKAYEGRLVSGATLDVRGEVPKARMKLEGDDFQIRPLLKDVLQKEFIEGKTFARLNLQMTGDDPEAIKRTVTGEGTLQFRDGAIVGIDLTGMVTNLKAAFGMAAGDGKQPRTDFAEFLLPFTVNKGVARTDGTKLTSPLLRVQAEGQADLVKESLDVRVEPTFVATLKGQGDATRRSGLSVPVIVKGTFSKPTFSPDLEGVLRQSVEGGLEQLITPKGKGKGDEGSPEDTVKGLLKGFGINP